MVHVCWRKIYIEKLQNLMINGAQPYGLCAIYT